MSRTIEERLKVLEDIQEITKLKHRYWNYCDGGRGWGHPSHDYDKIAELFVEDGVWESVGRIRVEGREAIREHFKRAQAVPFVIHCGMNPIIDVNGDTATGEWHYIIPITAPDDPRQACWIFGVYHDQFVRSPDGWRFKTLRANGVVHTPYELGWGKVQFIQSMLFPRSTPKW